MSSAVALSVMKVGKPPAAVLEPKHTSSGGTIRPLTYVVRASAEKQEWPEDQLKLLDDLSCPTHLSTLARPWLRLLDVFLPTQAHHSSVLAKLWLSLCGDLLAALVTSTSFFCAGNALAEPSH